MRSEAEFSKHLLELVGEAREGHLDRRELLRRAALMGLSTVAAGSLVAMLFSPAPARATPVRPPSGRPPPGTFSRPPAGGQGGQLNPGPGEDDAPPPQGGDEDAPPAQRGQGGAPPAQRGQGGAPPAQRGQGGAPPAQRGEGGAPPGQRGDDDAPPAQRGADEAPPASRSLFDEVPTEQGDLDELMRSRPLVHEPEPTRIGGSYRFGTMQPAEGGPGISFWLRSPYEGSPKILTQGWTMAAHVNTDLRDLDPERLAASIRWEGSGTFSSAGPNVTPTFARAGQNHVKLSLSVRGRVYSSTFLFLAKDADQYARLGARSQCHADVHGCPACPHPVVGPVISGSPTFLIGGRPLVRAGDRGTHAACCGPNTFTVLDGDPEILVDGRRASRVNDRARHCGGDGRLISAG